MRYSSSMIALVLSLAVFDAAAEGTKSQQGSEYKDTQQSTTSPSRDTDDTGTTQKDMGSQTGAQTTNRPREVSMTEIDTLPEESVVIVSGVVDSVSSKNSFELKDKTGKTVDVQTQEAVNLSEGQNIKVQGRVDSKLFGEKRIVSGRILR